MLAPRFRIASFLIFCFSLLALPAFAARPSDDDEEDPPASPVGAEVWKVALRGDEPVKGKPEAPVVVVVFVDFQCPFCARLQPTLDDVLKRNAGKVRIVFKHYPLSHHAQAMPAAEASLCAKDQGKFWEMDDQLFENQGELGPSLWPQLAKAIQLDLAKFNACMAAHTFKDTIAADIAGAEKVTATGTPTVFIQGRKMIGGRALDDFQRAIEAELKNVAVLGKAGVAAKDAYAHQIANGKEFTPPPVLDEMVRALDVGVSPVLGPKDAKYKVTVFADFQCPFSAKLFPLLKQVQQSRPDVAIVFKHFPLSNQCARQLKRDLHPAACLAAEWSMAAQAQGRFWELAERVFANVATLMPADGALAARKTALEGNLRKWAKAVGVDAAKAEKFVTDSQFQAQLDADLNAVDEANVRGTPSLFVNGRSYNGRVDAASLLAAIEKLAAGKL